MPDHHADLDLCAREPIHIPGSIQPHGVLLLASRPDWRILAHAGDLNTILGVRLDAGGGARLPDLLDADSVQRIEAAANDDTSEPVFVLDVATARGCSGLDAVIHHSGGQLIVEIEPRAGSMDKVRDPLAIVRHMMAAVLGAIEEQAFLNTVAAQVRSLTGFDRVMIYRFGEDESGEVVAEQHGGGVEPFLGLHYPASDIPAQARALYLRNWTRMIVDVDYAPQPIEVVPGAGFTPPLDLSLSALRSVSPVHLEYLRNMGVRASMSVSIICDGRLWGLIACHHYSGPRRLPFDIRSAAEIFGQMVSLQIQAREHSRSNTVRAEARRRQDDLVGALVQADDYVAGLFEHAEEVRRLLNADGLAIVAGGRLRLAGHTPPASWVERLVAWLPNRQDGEPFVSSRLGSEWPEARGEESAAAGVLAASISRHASDYLIWFRRERIHNVSWAGDPSKAVRQEDGGARISPRRSFEVWAEEVRGQSEPWQQSDLEVAREFRFALLELVIRSVDAAAAERARMDERQQLLIAELNHRVKNILASVQALVSQTRWGANSLQSFTQSLERRIQSMAQAHGLLTRSNWERMNLRSLLDEEFAAFADDRGTYELSGADIELLPQTSLALALGIHELVTNAAKYGALSVRQGCVHVRWGAATIDGRPYLHIAWRERDGPTVERPSRRGFGSTLIEKALAMETGGKVDVDYAPQGLSCDMYIPADQVVGAAPIARVETGDIDGMVERAAAKRRKILLVEDSALVVMSLEGLFEDMDWEIDGPAARLDEALLLAGSTDADVALLDVNLDGERSWDVAATLKSRGIPVVFATGYDSSTVLPAAYEGTPVVSKPFALTELEKMLLKIVEERV